MTKGALIKNSGTIAKICTSISPLHTTRGADGMIASMALPKAIEKMSTELGGLSALQREGKSTPSPVQGYANDQSGVSSLHQRYLRM